MILYVDGVRLVHWNPREWGLPSPLSRLRAGRRVSNFGDVLGPLIVRRLREEDGIENLSSASPRPSGQTTSRLLSVGSIMQMARTGDVIWGTGVNGKVPMNRLRFERLDVRAVRGPLTREILADRGIAAPPIYGDPAVLTPVLFPALNRYKHQKARTVGYLPNLYDAKKWKDLPGFISPRGDPLTVIRHVLQSEFIVTSSLHGLIIAEAFGIPVRLVTPGSESDFKYRDYVQGTGRADIEVSQSVADAETVIRDATEPVELAAIQKRLLRTFPLDMWNAVSAS